MKFKTIGALAIVALSAACSRKKDDLLTIPVQPVTRQTIVVQAEATGVVEPINVIEVKAKSSGQIVAMPVETGTFVKPGDLLVQLDTRDTRNAYVQAKADLDASNVNLRVSRQAKQRADQLFKERIITAVEHEAADVGYANAQATVLRNRAAADIRLQNLQDATVRAPVSGTVIEKDVALGQVIAGGGSVSGGTTILKMADLGKVRVRALVNETDIGKVKPGQQATVTVDAYPDRPFMGTVEKVEPQATIQQSVTMFPVLISIDNLARLLMPGMNGEVAVQVERRENVLALPNDAVRSMNEVAAVAPLLGLDPDSVRAELRNQGGARGNRVGSTQGGSANAELTSATQTQGAQAQAQAPQGGQGSQGGFNNLPEVTDKQCADVTAAMAKHPEVQTKLSDLRTRMMSGELDRAAMQAESQKIYSSIGLDPQVARACNFRNRGGGAGGFGNRGAAGASGTRGAQSGASGASGASGSTGGFGGFSGQGGFGGGNARRGLVFVASDTTNKKKYSPRSVRLGVSNYDYSEVLSGVKEGDLVAILNVAALQAKQAQDLNNIRGRAGVPGIQRQQPTQGGGAGGGARPGGAGGGGGQRPGGGG
ncbi:MAG TPA: efflux RND transporter periplasmic adaptor subunit [Gemmatimonadaceae bacterium]|nr:efflux RND transporter periplasmic adaptor subunit [Gemmatimonadaceae bacterium]